MITQSVKLSSPSSDQDSLALNRSVSHFDGKHSTYLNDMIELYRLDSSLAKKKLANLWRKLLRISSVAGAGGGWSWSDDYNPNRPHRHFGILFNKSKVKTPGLADPFLKEMVNYIEPDSFEDFKVKDSSATGLRRSENSTQDEILQRYRDQIDFRDSAAMSAILNFEELRPVGFNSFAMTNTYSGYHGIIGIYKSTQSTEEFLKQLIEFKE